MNIKRDKYLKELIDRRNNKMVKVITGIRRCGKSFLLFNIFNNYLLSNGVREENIIKIALDQISNIKYRNPIELSMYIKGSITNSNEMFYLFIDEIQFVEKIKNPYIQEGKEITFYEVLNEVMQIPNIDIYVTGSNSKMLSKDILTEFRGRGDEVRIMPLSFYEFMSVYKGDKFDGWRDYYTYGGLPAIIQKKTDEQKMDYLVNLFKETYLKDIVERNKVKNVAEMRDILNLLSSSIGSLTNPTKILNTFISNSVKISKNTIDSYIGYFEDSFLISKAMRYDVKGRKYINTQSKYYFTDIGLRNAQLNFRQQEESHIMENIIYNELLSRGFKVDVGIVESNEKIGDQKYALKQLEVDFIATKGTNKIYIQSALNMHTQEKQAQEQRPLKKINDSFKKVIIVKDYVKKSIDETGIITMNVFDFMLDTKSI